MKDIVKFEEIKLPEFKLVDNPSINISKVKARRFYILERLVFAAPGIMIYRGGEGRGLKDFRFVWGKWYGYWVFPKRKKAMKYPSGANPAITERLP